MSATEYGGIVKVTPDEFAAALTELGATVTWVKRKDGMGIKATGVTPDMWEQLYERGVVQRPRQRKVAR